MDINDFVKANMNLDGPAMQTASLNIVLFLADVSEANNWAGKTVKSYKKGDIATDFPSTHRAYKMAEAVFSQLPAIDMIKVAKREAGQSAVDALDISETKDKNWYCLVGLRGNDAILAAPWLESRRKIQMTASEDLEILTDSTTCLGSILKSRGYRRSSLFFNERSGKQLSGASLSVASGICTVSTGDTTQTEEVSVTTVVSDFTYSVTINSVAVEYQTLPYYHKQVHKIRVTSAIDSYDYKVTVAGNLVTYNSGIGKTITEIKDGLKAAINADSAVSAIVTAVNDTEGDDEALRIVANNEHETYAVAVGPNLVLTQITTLTPPSKTELAASIMDAINNHETVNQDVLAVNGDTPEKIKVVDKDPGTGFTIAVSSNLATATLTPHSGLAIGDIITIFEETAPVPVELLGNHVISDIPQNDQFSFPTDAADGVVTGDVLIDAAFNYPDAGLAGMGLAHSPGSLDWAHEDIVGVVPTDEDTLTPDAITNMEKKNVNFFHETAGKRLFWKGKMASGHFIDTIVDMDYLVTRLEEQVFDFITSAKKLPMRDVSMTKLKNLLDGILENEGKAKGITAPFIEDFSKYPDTGYPKGARAGDHYVTRVPRVRDLPTAERLERKIASGVEFEFQMAGGILCVQLAGNLIQ